MKIRKNDYQDILEYLIRKREAGEEFVAFPNKPCPINKEELFTFSTQYEVQEFCYEMSTDVDSYDYLAIRSAYRAMTRATRNNELMLEKEGVVDVSLMVTMYYRQLETAQLNKNQKTNVMNQKNFEYLRDQVKYTGFGAVLENELKGEMQKQTPEFKLTHTTMFGNDDLVTYLHFKKSAQTDMYFFNHYQVSLQSEQSKEKMQQTFYINKGNNITLKEAYNLMEGRAVNKDLTNKEGQVYNAWIQMDFKKSDDKGNFKLKHYHQNYGYDLEEVLSKHPIKELGNDDFKASLIDSLKKGNLQSATFLNNGTEQKHYIEANPQFKTINIYDHNLQRIDNRQSKAERKAKGESHSAKQDNKKEKQTPAEDDGPEMPKASKKRKKRQNIS